MALRKSTAILAAAGLLAEGACAAAATDLEDADFLASAALAPASDKTATASATNKLARRTGAGETVWVDVFMGCSNVKWS